MSLERIVGLSHVSNDVRYMHFSSQLYSESSEVLISTLVIANITSLKCMHVRT